MNESVSARVGRRIGELRASKGITRAELARQLGTTYQVLWKLETGRCGVSLDRLEEIAKLLDVPLHELTRLDE